MEPKATIYSVSVSFLDPVQGSCYISAFSPEEAEKKTLEIYKDVKGILVHQVVDTGKELMPISEEVLYKISVSNALQEMASKAALYGDNDNLDSPDPDHKITTKKGVKYDA